MTASKKKPEATTTKNKATDAAIEKIKDRFGDGAIMRLGEAKTMHVESIPTGSISLDLALGVGGIPKGRIIEIFGPESSGKTTLAQHIVAETQEHGGTAAFIDAEHALDPEYAKRTGVNINDLLISQPDTGEQALEITETLIRSNSVDVIVIDSVAALTPKAEIEGDMGDSHMGLQARLMSQALRKITAVVSKSKTTVIFLNPIRMKIGVMFGNPETTTGGNALKFYSSVRIDIRRIAQLKNGETLVGGRHRCKIVKNKVAPPFKQCEFDIIYAEGISKEGDLLDVATNMGIINKKGTWFEYEGQQLGQGREAAKKPLKDNVKLYDTIRKKVIETETTRRAEADK